MVTCPKCGNKVPAQKLIFLTNFSTITCPTCASKLECKNKRTGSLIGGVGGGVGGGLGALSAFQWFETGNVVYLILIAGIIAVVFFTAWIATAKLIEVQPKTR